ncbi:MAG: hypothetical protein V7L02_28195 [Nostoc sp.]
MLPLLLRSRLHQHEVFTAKQEGLDATDGASFQPVKTWVSSRQRRNPTI